MRHACPLAAAVLLIACRPAASGPQAPGAAEEERPVGHEGVWNRVLLAEETPGSVDGIRGPVDDEDPPPVGALDWESLGFVLSDTPEVAIHDVQPCAYDFDGDGVFEAAPDTPCFFLNLEVETEGGGAPVALMAVLRTPVLATLFDSRWVTFEPPSTGRTLTVPPGWMGSEGFNDDFIGSHNIAGYTTLEFGWDCPDRVGVEPHCEVLPAGVQTWMAQNDHHGNPWALDLEGEGYLGTALRVAALQRWAHAQSGRKLCAHGYSGGSGRLIGALTRDDNDLLHDTVVLNGGPVWSYIPWSCGIDTEVAPLPGRWDGGSPEVLLENYDESRRCDDPQLCDPDYHACRLGDFEPGMLDDSLQFSAERTELRLDLGVVLGGADLSSAWKNVVQYLSDVALDGTWMPALTEAQGFGDGHVALRQGYCEQPEDEFVSCNSNGADCQLESCEVWSAEGFPGVAEDAGTSFSEHLIEVGHGVPEFEEGARLLLEMMTRTCEL